MVREEEEEEEKKKKKKKNREVLVGESREIILDMVRMKAAFQFEVSRFVR